MTKLTEQSNIADIAAVYNELKGTNTDVKTLAKRGKAKLLAQIDALLEAQAEKKAEEQSAARADEPKAEEPKAEEPTKTDGVNHLVQQMLQAADKKEEPAKPRAKREPKAPKEKKEKGPVIRVVAEQLLLEVVTHDEDKRPYGHSYEEILNRIRAQFEGAKTTVACLRWYAVHMRERGEKVPNRPRATPTATAKKEV